MEGEGERWRERERDGERGREMEREGEGGRESEREVERGRKRGREALTTLSYFSSAPAFSDQIPEIPDSRSIPLHAHSQPPRPPPRTLRL